MFAFKIDPVSLLNDPDCPGEFSRDRWEQLRWHKDRLGTFIRVDLVPTRAAHMRACYTIQLTAALRYIAVEWIAPSAEDMERVPPALVWNVRTALAEVAMHWENGDAVHQAGNLSQRDQGEVDELLRCLRAVAKGDLRGAARKIEKVVNEWRDRLAVEELVRTEVLDLDMS